MILNGENRGGLGLVRSFGKKGIPVFVGGRRLLSRSLYSKYCKGGFVYSPVHEGIEKMHEDIIKNVKKFKPDVLFPVSSDTTHTVLKYIDEYKKYCNIIPTLDFKRFNIFDDKETLTKEAIKVKCPTPKTYFPKSLESVKELSEHIDYPVLIKPRIGSTAQGIVRASSSEELIKKYDQISHQKKIEGLYDPTRPTIQEFIPGEVYTAYVLFNKGKHIASMVNKFNRTYPVPYGPQLSNITVSNDRIRNLAITLFKRLKWHGCANTHFIVDERDNIPKMIEINPRIWATIESSVNAGVNFPYMLYKMALGEKVKENKRYKINQKFRWILFGELLYLVKSTNKLKTIKEYMNFKNTKTEIDFTDIKPHLIQFLDLCINKNVL